MRKAREKYLGEKGRDAYLRKHISGYGEIFNG